jgi:hypothetical protein
MSENRMTRLALMALISLVALWAGPNRLIAADPAPTVSTLRVPHGGVQPQAAVDGDGTLHMIYLGGPADAADIEYVSSTDGGQVFSEPVRVNSKPASALAIGTVRGAHLAVGQAGRVHVAWMGSAGAEPKAPDKKTPMLYARQNDRGDGFEPQVNLVQSHPGLDGGGSIAADGQGHVFVAWHAPEKAGGNETTRRVWITQSDDEGRTFAGEVAASSPTDGACGCCGMRLAATANGQAWFLFRSASENVNRDMQLLRFDPATGQSRSIITDPMHSSTCVMSTAAMLQRDKQLFAAWETDGDIKVQTIDAMAGKPLKALRLRPGSKRKHPALAVNQRGQLLVTWAEGTAWMQGGSVAWQVFDSDGSQVERGRGRAEGLPVWGMPAAIARPDGTFVVVY